MNSDEADLKSFFDHSLDLMCIAGFDGYFKRLNPAWERTLGYTTEELMAQPYRAFVHPDDFARTEVEASRINTGSNTIAFENRYRCKDGTYRWLEWRAQPDMERQIIFAAARDTTRFKQLEDELRAKSALQRAMLDGANLAIISCRTDGIIQGFNVGAEQLLGYKAAEVIGKTSPSIFHDPQEIARRAAALTQELGFPVEVGFHTFVAKALLGPPDENEWTYLRKDGSRLPVMLTVTIMRDDAGQPTGFLGIASDLTAKRKADRTQHELEARLQAILDNTTAVVFLKDRDGVYQMVNRRFEELFHLTKEQMAGKNDYDIFPPEFARAFRDNDAKVLATGQAMVLEEIAPHASVAHTYVSVKFPVLDSDGQVIALGGIATDITDRKQAEMELRDREARLSSILETAVEAIVTMDDKGLIQSINPAAAQIFGYQRGADHRPQHQRHRPCSQPALSRPHRPGCLQCDGCRSPRPEPGAPRSPQGRQHCPPHHVGKRDPHRKPGHLHRHHARHHEAQAVRGRSAALESGAGAVRLHRLPRSSGAPPHDHQLPAASGTQVQERSQ
ncbi:PAS domain S-box protein [Verrucomicrobium sp. BvORR106]|uniref:PAS domain S-box protein n=1 Tax=Verrucomicrobium sp. BvORR106 TaxID=1403819 RepID=UPI002240FC99|nr:PAS domain S-box protein [Verrucomicrobium sp. BvORR106]